MRKQNRRGENGKKEGLRDLTGKKPLPTGTKVFPKKGENHSSLQKEKGRRKTAPKKGIPVHKEIP